MNLAICDDEQAEREQLISLLYQYNPELQADLFDSASALLAACTKVPYDLILLDIEMPEPNGYIIAGKLHDLKPEPPLIIFTTKSSSYSVLGYDVAFHYLLKPISYEKFASVMDRAFRTIVPTKFLFCINGNTYVIPTKDIYYIEVMRTTMYIHRRQTTQEVRLSMKYAEKELSDAGFCKTHQSFLVNLRYVDSITSDSVILTNGDTIPVSRAQKKGFNAALQAYLRLS